MAAADPQARIEDAGKSAALARLTIQKREAEIQQLLERLRKQRVGFLGPGQRTLSDLQLKLLVETRAFHTREEWKRSPVVSRSPSRASASLIRVASHCRRKLPRIEEVNPVRDELCALRPRTRLIGYDTSEVLDARPAKWFCACDQARKTRVRKMFCACGWPNSRRASWKGLASDCVVIETVISKYCDHVPLYRQEAMLRREAGVDISRATLDGWVMRVGELLEPVVGAMRADLVARIVSAGR